MTAQSPRPLDSLTSSAKLLTSKSLGKGGLRAQSESWHDDAWNMYDLVGELHFLVTNIANRMSQARFYVGTLPDEQTDDPEETTDEQLGEILSAVGGGGSSSDLTQLVNRLGANLFVAGDGWLVGIPRGLLDENSSSPGAIENLQDASLDDLDWRMLSTNEVTQASGGQVRLLLDHNQQVETGIDNLFLIRVWRPHPRKVWESDSPVRAGMPILRELVGLTMHISAQVDSRLAGAGLIAVPSSAVQAMRQQRGLTEDDPEDPFTDALMEAMLKPIEDRSSASAVVPLVASVPDEAADKIKHLTFSTELDANAKELREEAIRRLALSLDCPPELLLGMSGMNHWGCLRSSAEILTQRGWLTQDQLVEGDQALTLNHDTGESEWQEVERVCRYEVTDEPLTHHRSYNMNTAATANHRWPVINRNTGTRTILQEHELTDTWQVPTAAPAVVPGQGKYTDSFVEALAWFWTEGWESESDNQSCIAQSESANPARCAAIRQCLTDAFGPGAYGETRQQGQWGSDVVRFNLATYVREALDDAGGKYPTGEFIRSLTTAQLELFIHTSCAGDGWHYSRGELDIWQRDPEALRAFELALILSGRSVTWTEHNDGWAVYGSDRQVTRPTAAQTWVEEYTGTIWCPVTNNSTWLARENGTVFFTGNSWIVREDVISTHIEPPLALICDALTQQYLRPMMVGAGYSEEEAARHVIWYDVSHLIMRPNRADDAERLYQAGELSGDAYRRALNFEEDDAPAQEESELTQAQDAALDMIKNAPSLAQDPGIVQLAQQIQDMLDGKSADESSAPAPESGEQEPEPAESPDDGGPPQSTPEGPPMAASGAWQPHLWERVTR